MTVSDAKQAAAQAIAEAQRRLDEALAELDRLPAVDAKAIGLAAHALNNFLFVARAGVELLQRTLQGYPDPDVHRWLEGLGHSTDLMVHTVSRLLSTSARALPRLKVHDVDLARLVQRACAYYQRSASQRGIELIFSATNEVPVIATDGVVVAAVIDNLLSNAVKYTPAGKRIFVRIQGQRDGAICSVQDEGPGLSEDEQAGLFQPGTRLGPEPAAGESSTGYGLALAKEFVDTLSGRIWASSVKGEGTTFSFSLPLRPEKSALRR